VPHDAERQRVQNDGWLGHLDIPTL
jgi:hypothetical protein